MVNLTITPHRGNGARTFPSTGYLGLSPVTLAGVVRVKIEEDLKPIEASSLVVRVRCYETLTGAQSGSNEVKHGSSSNNVQPLSSFTSSPSYSISDLIRGTTSTTAATSSSTATSSSMSTSQSSKGRVLYEKNLTMWLPPTSSSSNTSSPPSSPETSAVSGQRHAYPPRRESATQIKYGTLGEFTKAWRIVIPPEAVAQGAKSTMIFKSWRIWWAVEAVISHRPLGIHGDRIVKSHQVALLSYAPVPSLPVPLEWSSNCAPSTSTTPQYSSTPSLSHHHHLSYSISSPDSTFGSSDPVSFNVFLSKRSSNAETPKKVTLELRREIVFHSHDSPAAIQRQTFETVSSTLTKKISNAAIPTSYTSRHSGSQAPYAGNANGSRYKSESQEALISPPPLTNASTLSSYSSMTPSTPPLHVPTPSEYTGEGGGSESYFGFFGNGHGSSPKSNQTHPVDMNGKNGGGTARQTQFQHVHCQPVHLTLPSTSTTYPSYSVSSSASPVNNKASTSSQRKKEDLTLATFEADCYFGNSPSGSWVSKITGNMPKAKSLYHYALGETCTTLVASSRFYIIPKIHYKSKNTFIELPPQNVTFATVSQEDRKKAEELLPKILAIQRAEARLFGGIVTEEDEKKTAFPSTSKPTSSSSMRVATHKASSASMASSPAIITTTTSSRTSAPNHKGRASRSVSPSRAGSSSNPGPNEDEEMEAPKLNTGRRRSEQPELLTCPRSRQRFGSTPDLSPIVGSPYIDAVSPSLSVISSSTQRPRTGGSGTTSRFARPATGHSSIDTTAGIRPTSSAGLSATWSTHSDASSSGQAPGTGSKLADISRASSSQTTDSEQSVPPIVFGSESSQCSSMITTSDSSPELSFNQQPLRPINKTGTKGKEHHESHFRFSPSTASSPLPLNPATVNGLFADFSGFSLKPPDKLVTEIPIIKEELVHPKYSSSSAHSTTHKSAKRKSGEMHVGSSHTAPKMAHHDDTGKNASLQVMSGGMAMQEITIAASPVSASMNPNSASNNSLLHPHSPAQSSSTKPRSMGMTKSVSQTGSIDSLSVSGDARSPARRPKGGMSGAFSFFRRSSTKA